MSNHWYDIHGKPAYTVIGVNGKKRDTTLADARKHKYVPSVTTLLGLIDKEQLNRWKQNQLLDAVIDYAPPRKIHGTYPYRGFEDAVKTWKDKVIIASQRAGKNAADRGSQIHNSLEKIFKKELTLLTDPNSAITLPVIDCIDEFFGPHEWRAEDSFSHESGFGGQVDLHSKIDDGVVLDFKTKSMTANFYKDLAYPEHCMQVAAYRHGLGLPKARCYNLFISTETPGLLQLKTWTDEELVKGWKMFQCLLTYWRLDKGI